MPTRWRPAAHPTLPLPSYVRVTNLSNSSQLVVRVNDRDPYTPGHIIDLTRAATDRLNISNNTEVRVDFIEVAPDGTLTGPGAVGTVVAKQSFALPPRPDLRVTGASGDSGAALSSGNCATMVGNSGAAVPAATGRHAAANGALLSADGSAVDQGSAGAQSASQQGTAPLAATGQRSGFLGVPSALPVGVVETQNTETAASAVPPAADAASPAASGRFMVQVGAIGDAQRADNWQKSLSNLFSVPGRVSANGNLFRVQLGPFQSRQQAQELVQRLQIEVQQQVFITAP